MTKQDLQRLLERRDHTDQMLDAARRLRYFYTQMEKDAREEKEYRDHLRETYPDGGEIYDEEAEASNDEWKARYYWSWDEDTAREAREKAFRFYSLALEIESMTREFVEWYGDDSEWEAMDGDINDTDVQAWYDDKCENCLPEVYKWSNTLFGELIAEGYRQQAIDSPLFERDTEWYTDNGFIGRV